MRQRVVIVGGGVAGLSAAHELAERDFEVHVFERNVHFGGKAASIRERGPWRENGTAPHPAAGSDRTRVPGEHGFRFYPGWYRHLPDTMARIPYKGKRRFFEGATVADNLVSADEELLAWYGREPMQVVAHPPHDLQQARTALGLVSRMRRLGLRPGEVAFFFGKLAEFLATPESARAERFDKMTWWEYLDADKKSPAYQNLITASTRTMVAAKAKEASAYTIANVAIRTLLDGFGTVDRMLNGPTNEVWIDPWIAHLRERGVEFHLGQELSSIEFNPDKGTVKAVHFTSLLEQNQQRLQWSLRQVQSWQHSIGAHLLDWDAWKIRFDIPWSASDAANVDQVVSELPLVERLIAPDLKRIAEELAVESDVVQKLVRELIEWPPCLPPDMASDRAPSYSDAEVADLAQIALAMRNAAGLLERLRHELRETLRGCSDAVKSGQRPLTDAAPVKRIGDLRDEIRDALKSLELNGDLRRRLDAVLAREAPPIDGTGDFFVFALPIEQMAYYVNRSPTLTHYDPSLRRLLLLAEHVDWMVGIQFYLKETVNLVRGHLVCMDSEWSLTAVEHTQFWRDIELPSDVKSIISVDIAAWDRKGRFNRKEAFNCTQSEIAEETWMQLIESLNRENRGIVLREEMLRFGRLESKKGGVTRRSYHLDDGLVNLLDRRKQGTYEKARSVRFSADELLRRQRASGHESDTPYVWGHRLNFNVEPLLINRVGTLTLRPEARTAVPNMFLAADYVRTGTDLACMESANEAARHAVNGLLDAAGSRHAPCKIWAFSPSQSLLDGALSLARVGGKLDAVASGALKAATGPLGRFAEDLLSRGRR